MTAGESEAIKHLQDVEAIKKVKYQYCYHCDTRDHAKLMALFAKDCSADYGPFGNCKNRAEVSKFFVDIYKTLPFFIHMVNNDIIEIKGDKATGEWYFNVPSTHAPTNQAIWILGKYEDEFVREGGGWKIKSMICKFYYVTPYDKGWVKRKMV